MISAVIVHLISVLTEFTDAVLYRQFNMLYSEIQRNSIRILVTQSRDSSSVYTFLAAIVVFIAYAIQYLN